MEESKQQMSLCNKFAPGNQIQFNQDLYSKYESKQDSI